MMRSQGPVIFHPSPNFIAMIKNAFFLLAVCWLGTSCAPKYGCPYFTETQVKPQTEIQPVQTVSFTNEALPESSASTENFCE